MNTGRLHIWSLLLLAGLIAAIGGTVAYFFTEGGLPSEEEARTFVVPVQSGEIDHRERQFGRPRPEVKALPPSEEPWREVWPEDEISKRPSPAPPLQASAARANPPSAIPDSFESPPSRPLPTAAPPASISTVASRRRIRTKLDAALAELEAVGSELDDIERESTSRRAPTKPAS